MSQLAAPHAQVGRVGTSSPLAGNAVLHSRPGQATYNAPPSPALAAPGTGPHLLSLKVMRISAPALAVTDTLYYGAEAEKEVDPILSAVQAGLPASFEQDLLTSAPALRLAEKEANWPISNLLVLPDSFGTIFLGETFRAYLCIRNESQLAMREPSLRIEMQIGDSPSAEQNAAARIQLQYLILEQPTSQDASGNDVWELAPGQAMETTSSYDIKDLGAHVLVCTVGYKSPVHSPSGDVMWQERSFRKFYKFPVPTSPISVRTKVHNQRSPAAIMHPDFRVRQQVALEVQVQNISGSSLVFEGLNLRPANGWTWNSIDRPSITSGVEPSDSSGKAHDMWTGSHEFLSDGDVRQYLFTLTPLSSDFEKSAVDHGASAEGLHIVGDPIGNLEISWRMTQGEPGRLQTSQLLRRRVYSPPTPCPRPIASTETSRRTQLPDPLLSLQLTVRQDTQATLSALSPGSDVKLGFSLTVDDFAAPRRAVPNPPTDPRHVNESKGQEEDEDDDRPLSELAASSPSARARRSRSVSINSAHAPALDAESAAKPVTLRRTLKLAVQHCTVERSAPTEIPGLQTGTGAIDTRLPTDRPSTPTLSSHTSSSLLGRTRLQANLSNLVRNTSLSVTGANPLRRQPQQRGSMDVADTPEYRTGSPLGTPSRTSTPGLPPALPSKMAPLPDAGVTEDESAAFLPPPVVSWASVLRLYVEHIEAHAQALSRPQPTEAGLQIPTSVLPSQDGLDALGATVQSIGSSLVTLPDLQLELSLKWDPSSSTFSAAQPGSRAQGAADFDLSYAISAGRHDGDGVVRFGALRVMLLGWTDSLTHTEEDKDTNWPGTETVELDRAIVLKEILVAAEGLLQ